MFEEIKKVLKRTLSPARFRHSLAVAELAAELGKKHGWLPTEAYRAGLVHDCAKEWPPKNLIEYARKNKLKIPNITFMTRHAPNLLHAYVGAHFARQKKWITNEKSRQAISSHTLGRIRMSAADQILYIADFSSKDRKFNSAASVRILASQNLREGFLLALTKKMEFNLLTHKPIHPLALRVWNQEVS